MNTTRTELISSLIADLLPTSQLTVSEAELSQLSPNDQRVLLRALMNLWQPGPLDADFRRRQDALLQAERDERGIVTIQDTQAAAEDPRIRLWQGDITRLATDGIVNAANNKLLGCFRPGHTCVDNAIHSAAGPICAAHRGPHCRREGGEPAASSRVIRQLYLMPEPCPQFGAEVPRLLLHFHRGLWFPTITCCPHCRHRSPRLPGWAIGRHRLHHYLHSIHPG